MPRTLSQLAYTRIQEIPDSMRTSTPTVITLHPYRGRGADLKDYARAAAPNGHLLGLESYKGVFVGRNVVGYMWFVGPDDAPAPVFFGDALGEIERFLWDEIDRQASDTAILPFLLGVGQGAIMALAAAAAVPDLLSGVIAIEGSFPLVPGWNPPLAPLDGLPILLVDPPGALPARPGVLVGDMLSKTLTGWGGAVTRATSPTDTIPEAIMREWITKQVIRTSPAR